MIYISSSGFKRNKIKEILNICLHAGWTNIELSGGSVPYPTLEKDLIYFQRKNNFKFIIHNYFPPPENDFIMNLASLNDTIYYQSMSQALLSIDLAKRLQIKKIGFHAGFLLDFSINELGHKIITKTLFPIEDALSRFFSSVERIQHYAGKDIKVYFENNVFSHDNKLSFPDLKPFLLTNSDDYFSYVKKIPFNLLLDIGHLHVSCKTENRSFHQEMKTLILATDYLHISDNNGLKDSHDALSLGGTVYRELQEVDLSGKTITLELHREYDIRKSHIIMQSLIS
jgi:sugar phosphate isomerase/epimerase